MSDTSENTTGAEAAATGAPSVKLQGLYLKKVGMTSVYSDSGEQIPVTVLKMEPWYVSQVKTEATDGYNSVQIASEPKKPSRVSRAETVRLKPAGFETGAKFVREVRQNDIAGISVGASVSLDSVAKGDVVRLTSVSKGKGFAGSVKRFNFAGGPAAHGSKFHRQPGSSGNRTWPGRVMPGKKFPGHLGAEVVTVKNVKIVDVLPEENVVLVKGPVPGARNTLVKLVKG